MDESSAYTYSESSPPRRRTHHRKSSDLTQTSASSQAFFPPRLKTPALRERHASISAISNGLNTDIVAPIPQRHHNLQPRQSRHWLGSPSPSISSSRPVSPLSNATASPEHRKKRHRLSISSLMEHDSSRRSSLSIVHPPRSHQSKKDDESGMGKVWVRWMHKHGLRNWVVPCAVLAAAGVKWCIGLGSYSGQGTPPMFGDFEAQRHWMELTVHLPIRQWYTYDLQYWGMDYPPLTAYVSWLCGIIGSWIDPAWFALDRSRGIETQSSKLYMRSSVLALDSLIYVPALLMSTSAWQGSRSSRTQHLALLILLLHPALLLIDFGHFQYNSIMLGFTLLSVNFLATGQDLLGAFFFVLSLGFKQMALYYAPAIGSYLLGKCVYLGPVAGLKLFIRLGIVTVATFLLLFLPFLPPFAPLGAILDPIMRIFPFNRGLFEDKVANFWCATNVVFKWKLWASRGALVKLSTALTTAGFLPGVVGLVYGGYKMQVQPAERTVGKREAAAPAPTLSLLPYALLTSSMSFFLFSFQVHEKTILLPLLPLTLLLSGATPTSSTFELGVLVNNVAVFSMWPLLKRDGLGVQYIAVTLLWNRLIGYNPFRAQPESLLRYLSMAVYATCLALHVLELLVPPPARLPDLFPVLNVLVSTPVFALAWLWSIKRGVQVSWALRGLGAGAKGKSGGSGESHTSEGIATVVPLADRIGREAGLRAMSLGHAQGRRRAGFRSSMSAEPSRGSLDFKRSSMQFT